MRRQDTLIRLSDHRTVLSDIKMLLRDDRILQYQRIVLCDIMMLISDNGMLTRCSYETTGEPCKWRVL